MIIKCSTLQQFKSLIQALSEEYNFDVASTSYRISIYPFSEQMEAVKALVREHGAQVEIE